MNRPQRSVLLALVLATALLFLFVQVARAVDLSDAAWVRFRDSASSIRPPPTAQPVGKLPAIEQLVCFKCHNIDRYRSGDEFAHAGEHAKVGHCHLCHAIEGHLQLTVRESTCERCH